MKMFNGRYKNRQFKKIYLLTGEEVYLRNQYRKRLREALIDPEDTMNCSVFEGKNINPREVIDLAETMPFFAERRVILIDDSGFAKNGLPGTGRLCAGDSGEHLYDSYRGRSGQKRKTL